MTEERYVLAYHRLLTAGRPSRWWVLLGVALVVVFFLVAQTVAAGVIAAGLILGGLPTDVALDRLSGTDEVTPSFLALVNLGWAAAIPAVVLAVWLVHGLHPGWAVSVVRRVRWGWFATCLGLSLVALVATLLVSAVLPAQGNGAEITGELNSWSRTMRDFLLVVVLLTPLQAAGEEFAFRGYLTQAVGTLVPSRLVAVVVPALLFALAHGAQDPPVFVDRFAFGLVAGFLVLATGGLEAGIAMHVLNNLLAFGMALAFSDMTSAMNPSGGTWWSLPVTLTQSLVYLGVVLWVARRRGIATEGTPAPWGAPRRPAGPPPPPSELVGPDPRV
ncbi:MAG: CPBP family intramembrane metalloprotease [Actinobacteria bacterium]|nr:CPBP family intramembrane metalloprotease [Actinomycetota bacterium]MBU2110647.1 CPBP family intramembrane metalloprotease [Actinomycetota bacterium]